MRGLTPYLSFLPLVEELDIGCHRELDLFQRLLNLAQQFHLCLSCDALNDQPTLFAIFKHMVEVYHKSPDHLGEVIWCVECGVAKLGPFYSIQKVCTLPGGLTCVIPSTYHHMLM